MIRHALIAAALVAVAPAARAQMVDQARCYAAAERLIGKLKPDDKSFLEVKRILEHNAQATKKP